MYEHSVEDNGEVVVRRVTDKKFPTLRGSVLNFNKKNGVYMIRWDNDGFIEQLPCHRVTPVTRKHLT